MADQTLAQQHPAEVWATLIGSLGMISTLVGVLYYRLNKDISDHDKKLEDTNKTFVDIGNRLVALGEKIANIQTEDVFTNGELDRIVTDIKDLNNRLLVIETEHKNCKESRK